MEVTQSCQPVYDPMDCSLPCSSDYGIIQQKYWSGLPFHSPMQLSNPGIKPEFPALQEDSLPFEPPGKPQRRMGHERVWTECGPLEKGMANDFSILALRTP